MLRVVSICAQQSFKSLTTRLRLYKTLSSGKRSLILRPAGLDCSVEADVPHFSPYAPQESVGGSSTSVATARLSEMISLPCVKLMRLVTLSKAELVRLTDADVC